MTREPPIGEVLPNERMQRNVVHGLSPKGCGIAATVLHIPAVTVARPAVRAFRGL